MRAICRTQPPRKHAAERLFANLFQFVPVAGLLLSAPQVSAGTPVRTSIVFAQVDESVFGDSEKIRPNWWSETRGDDRTSMAHFLAWMSTEIQERIAYPERSRRHGQQGTVLIAVLLHAGNMPPEISLVKSSGYKLLDEEALRVVGIIEPASYPPEFRIGEVVLVPVVFRLTYGDPPDLVKSR